jgi:hypothetical protein
VNQISIVVIEEFSGIVPSRRWRGRAGPGRRGRRSYSESLTSLSLLYIPLSMFLFLSFDTFYVAIPALLFSVLTPL